MAWIQSLSVLLVHPKSGWLPEILHVCNLIMCAICTYPPSFHALHAVRNLLDADPDDVAHGACCQCGAYTARHSLSKSEQYSHSKSAVEWHQGLHVTVLPE